VAVELFAAAASRPDVIFCDTSFILDVLSHQVSLISSQLVGSDAPKRARAAAAAAFFARYRADGVQFVSSPYAFQELAHILTKWYPRVRGYKSWEAFQKVDRVNYDRAYPKSVRLSFLAWRETSSAGILYTLPEIGAETPYGRHSEDLIRAARLLKKKYKSLDWADVFHISVGSMCGVEWFASTDAWWKDVNEINVFAYA